MLCPRYKRTWAEREDRQVLLVLERETNHEHDRLTDVTSEEVQRERLDVVERAAALPDSGDDGREVVVSQHDV